MSASQVDVTVTRKRKGYNRLRKIIPEALLVIFIAVVALGLYDCPINALFGIECPGCSMTEAMFRLAKSDIKGAFSENCLFPVPIFWAIYTFIRNKRAFPRRVEDLLVIVTVALFLARWILLLTLQ